MKNIIVLISTLLLISNCKQITQNNSGNNNTGEGGKVSCTDLEFQSIRGKSESLTVFFNELKTADSTERTKIDRLFFCAFPSSFKGMEKLFGYDREIGESPLYFGGRQIVGYFSTMTSVPKKEYYGKYIKICIDGTWQADNIVEGFGLAKKLLGDDTAAICTQLSMRTNEEIKSVFHFIFDGPHPINDYNKSLYDKLLVKIIQHDKRIGDLMTESYNELMAKDHSH